MSTLISEVLQVAIREEILMSEEPEISEGAKSYIAFRPVARKKGTNVMRMTLDGPLALLHLMDLVYLQHG